MSERTKRLRRASVQLAYKWARLRKRVSPVGEGEGRNYQKLPRGAKSRGGASGLYQKGGGTLQ